MMFRLGQILFASAALAGCTTEPPQQPEPLQSQMVWLRLDGQRGAGNPALNRQFEIDRKVCLGSAPSDIEVSAAAKACMTQKGYIQVPTDQAETKSRELAAANARR
jgi:hypothetical protein